MTILAGLDFGFPLKRYGTALNGYSMRLTDAELATMRAEHVPTEIDGWAWCRTCTDADVGYWSRWPCDAARVLAHFAPGPVPHLAGIAQVPIEQINHCHSMPDVPTTARLAGIADDHCHCGADGMEMSHPRHAPTSDQQAAIGVGLLGPSVESELSR